jgi:hypothetical protein
MTREQLPNIDEQVGAISDQEADAMTALATRLRIQVRAWLTSRYPDLMPLME